MEWTEEERLNTERLHDELLKNELPQLYSTTGKYQIAVDFYKDIHKASVQSIGDEYHGTLFLLGISLKTIACQHYLMALKGNIHSALAWFGCLDYISGLKLDKYKRPIYEVYTMIPNETTNSYKDYMLSKRQFYYMSVSELILLGCSRKDACRRVASSYWLEKKNLRKNFPHVASSQIGQWMPNAATLHDQYIKFMKDFDNTTNSINVDSDYPFLYAHKIMLNFDGKLRLWDVVVSKYNLDSDNGYADYEQFEKNFLNFKMPIENKPEVLGKLYLKGRPDSYKEKN